MSTKRRAPSKIAAPVTKPSARLPTKVSVNEANAAVSSATGLQSGLGQGEAIEISSGSESAISSDSEDEELDLDNGTGLQSPAESPQAPPEQSSDSLNVNGKDTELRLEDAAPLQDIVPDAATDATESDAENAPTFGELLRGQETIDVAAVLAEPSGGHAAASHGSRALTAPSISLGTALNQALKTDDTEMLESCLCTTDLVTVRNTIERLDSSLAGVLLTNLATRLHRRPGRAGSLMQWVQWTLVAHGGALASQPQALSKLSSLQKVLAERARGLNSLLILKGKLDLLEAQVQLRKRMAYAYSPSGGDGEENLIVDEEAIDVSAAVGHGAGAKRKREDEDEDDEVEDVPVTNGIGGDSDDEEDDSEAVEEDEANDEESLDEDEVDHEDVDLSMGEDEDSDVETAPPAKVQKTTTSFSRGAIQS